MMLSALTAGIGVTVTALSAPAQAIDNFEFRTDGAMPYLDFDKLESTKISVPGGLLDVRIASGKFAVGNREILRWAERCGRSVATYFGALPVKSARVLIVPVDGAETSGGQAFGNAGAAVRLFVGKDISRNALAQDWQLTHEMVHLTFPAAPKPQWLTEGMAVYVEPIARVQAGDLTAEYIWHDFAKMLPDGLPKPGDKGLDKAEQRQRVYEGGALFWITADIEIRRATNNRVGVQQALQAIARDGGTIEKIWPAEKALAIGDEATGQHILMDMRKKWGAAPVSVNLESLWADLGVKVSGDNVTFNDYAPLAHIRKAITAKPGPSPALSKKGL